MVVTFVAQGNATCCQASAQAALCCWNGGQGIPNSAWYCGGMEPGGMSALCCQPTAPIGCAIATVVPADGAIAAADELFSRSASVEWPRGILRYSSRCSPNRDVAAWGAS